jgi:hypothetical protein
MSALRDVVVMTVLAAFLAYLLAGGWVYPW